MKTAVIDVGGGMRDIYGSGVFDFCLDNGILVIIRFSLRSRRSEP
jgi:predicted patatin/cPLA2 family phospholipase